MPDEDRTYLETSERLIGERLGAAQIAWLASEAAMLTDDDACRTAFESEAG